MKRRFRYLRRTTIALLVALTVGLLLFLGFWKFLQNPRVCAASARYIESLVARNTDGTLKISSLSWQLFPPRLKLEDTDYEGPDLKIHLHSAGIYLRGFHPARRSLVLSTVEIDGVDIEMQQAADSSKKKRADFPISIVIDNLSLRRLSFNGHLLKGSLDIHGGELAWVREGIRNIGFLRIEKCRLKTEKMNEVQFGLAGSFSREGTDFGCKHLLVSGPDFHLQFCGKLSKGNLKGKLKGKLKLKELDRVIRTHHLLHGDINFDIDIDSGREDPLRVHVESRKLVVAKSFTLRDFAGDITLFPDGLQGELRHALFFGGNLRGSYRLDSFSSFSHEVKVHCRGMDLGRLLRVLHVPPGGLSAGMDVSVSTHWKGRSFPRGEGLADIVFSPRQGALPVKGGLTLALQGENFLEFDSQNLHIGSSLIELQGPLTLSSWRPAWAIHAESLRLQEVLPAVNRWVGSKIFPLEISGGGQLDLSLDGPWSDLRVGILLDARNLAYPPIKVDRVNIEGLIAGGSFQLKNGHFRLGKGAGSVRGSIRWKDQATPSAGTDMMDLHWDARKLPLERIAEWAGLKPGLLQGQVSFTGGLRGSLNEASGSWALGLQQLLVDGISCGNGSASVSLDGCVFRAQRIDFDRGLRGEIAWDVSDQNLAGDLKWMGMELSGKYEVLGPRMDWETHFSWPLEKRLPGGELKIQSEYLKGHCLIEDRRISAEVQLKEVLNARLEIPRYEAEGKFEGRGEIRIPSLENFSASIFSEPDLGLSGETGMTFEFSGQGGKLQTVNGEIDAFDVFLDGQRVELRQAGVFRLEGAEAQISETILQSGKDQIQLACRMGAGKTLDGYLRGDLDLRLLRFLLPEWEAAGFAEGSVQIHGKLDAPFLSGDVLLKKSSFRLPGTSMVLSDVGGRLQLDRGAINFEETVFRLLKGRGHGSGVLELGEGVPRLDFSGEIDGMEFPLFEGLTPRVSGSWRLGGTVGDFLLSGDLTLDSAELRSKQDLPTLLLGWFGGEEAPKKASGISFDLHINGDESIIARSPLIRLTGSADLRLLGSPDSLGLEGEISFEDGGEVTVQGIRYDITSAHLSFNDPSTINPMMNLNMEARIQEYQVWVRLNGGLDHLIPVVSSDPPLSPPEIYSLMSLGSPDSGAGAGGAIGLSVASSMLSNRFQDALEERDLWLLPIDQLRIDPFIENATGDPSARVSVVKQLSPNLTVTLQSDLSAEKNQVITGRWYLGAGLFIEASRDQDQQIGIDFKLRRRY